MKNKDVRRISAIIVLGMMLVLTTVGLADEYSAWTHYHNAAAAFKKGEISSIVIDECEAAKKETSDSVLFARISFLQANVLAKDGKFEAARNILQEVISTKQDMPDRLVDEASLRKSILYLTENKAKDATPILRSLYEQSSQRFIKSEAAIALAWQAAGAKDWETCRNLANEIEADTLLPDGDERIHFVRALLAEADSKPEEAIGLLEGTENPLGLSILAKAYEMAGRQILAVSLYKKLNDRHPRTLLAENAMFQAAEVFLRAEDWLAAQSELKRFLQYFPDSKYRDAIHFRLGWVYFSLGQIDYALSEFNSYADAGNQGYFQYMEAECYRTMGAEHPENYQEAIRLFNNIASLNMRATIAPMAKIKAAMTEFEKGDTASALISLKQFLSIYPRNEMVSAVNFMLATNQKGGSSGKYFNKIVQSTVTGSLQDAAFFALQNEDYQHGNYQEVINRFSFLKEKKSESGLNFWNRANYLLIAESAYFLKHYDLAKENYQLVLSEKSDELQEKAELGLAWCDFYTKGIDSAAVQFQALKKSLSYANKPLAEYGYAVTLFHRGEYEKAIQEYPVNLDYQGKPEYGPVVMRSLYNAAQCYSRLEYYAQAIECWEKLAKEFPQSQLAADALYHAADLYFRANYFPQADSVYSRIITIYPESAFASESQLRLGQSAYNAGNYKTAIQRYQNFINQYPKSEKSKTALEGIQYSYYQMGQTEQAAETFRIVAEQSANTDLAVDARYRIATNYLAEEKYEEAATELKDILTLYPNSTYAADAQFSLAKAFMAQDKNQDAVREFQQFIRYFPQNNQVAEANFLLGISYFGMESYLSAIDCFNEVIQQHPESEFYGSSLQNAAWSYDRLGDHEKSLEYFQKYLSETPEAKDREKIQLGMAGSLIQLHRNAEAEATLGKLSKSSQGEIACEAAYRLGMLYLDEEKPDQAITNLKAAIKAGEASDYYRLSAIAQLAAVYENDGEDEKAISAYKLLTDSTTEARWVEAANERIQALTSAEESKP